MTFIRIIAFVPVADSRYYSSYYTRRACSMMHMHMWHVHRCGEKACNMIYR